MRYKLKIQFFGGRGSGSGGGGTGGIDPRNIVSTTSLISEREGSRSEVDETLKVLKDIEKGYGIDVYDAKLATLKGKDSVVMAYYDNAGNLAVNESYFNSDKMNSAYDKCVKSGFHPSRGDKTGLEAVVAHEMGHRLNHALAGDDWERMNRIAGDICKKAKKQLGYSRVGDLMSKVSKYAKENYAETIAEAFADVYCNGKKAGRESTTIVNELNRRLGGKL